MKMHFKIDTTYGYNKGIHERKVTKYKTNILAAMNTVNTIIKIILNRKMNLLNIIGFSLEIDFFVSNKNW